jgi:hypothetical protein
MPSSDVTNGDGEDIEMDLSRVDENHYEDEDEERVEPTGLGNLGELGYLPFPFLPHYCADRRALSSSCFRRLER